MKLLSNDDIKSAILKGTLALFIVVIVSTIFILVRVLIEKNSLDKRYESYSKLGTKYTISGRTEFSTLFGGDAKVKELSNVGNSFLEDFEIGYQKKGYKAYFPGTGGLNISLLQFSDGNIFTQQQYAESIFYKKEKYYEETETYYEPYNIYYNSNASPLEYTSGGLKERTVLKENQRESPIDCYQLCKDFFQKNELKNFEEVKGENNFVDDFYDNINSDNKYYNFRMHFFPESKGYFSQTFTSNNFDIEIKNYTIVYQRMFSWPLILEDIMFYSLLLFAFPFFYYLRFIISKLN